MIKKYLLIRFLLLIFICVIFTKLNEKTTVITIPEPNNMIDYQFNLFTISSVFAGFAFTMLGILLGMSSEKLIERIRKTDIIIKKCRKIVLGLFFFCFSGIISLFFVVGIINFLNESMKIGLIYQFSFICVVVFLLGGLLYFVISFLEIADLIRRIYGYDKSQIKKEKAEFKQITDEAREYNKKIHSDFIE